MDAIKFINEAKRMCKSFGDDCTGCPAFDNSLTLCKLCIYCEYSEEEKLSIVEKWSKEHPAKTRQSVFLEQYPEARIRSDGVLSVCPAAISSEHRLNDEDVQAVLKVVSTAAESFGCRR